MGSSDKNKKVVEVGKKEVAKNRIFGMPTTRMTRHQRVAFTAMIKIAYDELKQNNDKQTFEYPTDKFFKLLGITEKRKSSKLFTKTFIKNGWEMESEEYALEKTLKALVNKSIDMRYKDADGKVYKSESIALISYFKLTKDKVIFRFDEWVREKIYVTNNYYLMKLPILASFKSGYAVTLFEQIEQRRDFKRWEIDIEKLRLILGIEKDKYTRFDNFKNRVLDKAKNEIVEKTNYNISIEYIKESRKISKVVFRWAVQKTTFEEFKEFIRREFVGKDLIELPSKDRTMHLISVDDNGRLYNKRKPDKFYTTSEAKSVWEYMYENQNQLEKYKREENSEYENRDWTQYYGKDLLYDDELYKNIISIAPTKNKNKLKVKMYSGEIILIDIEDFLKSLTFIPKPE